MAPEKAVSDISIKYGKVMRNMVTASSKRSPDTANPGANSRTTQGAPTMPITVTINREIASVPDMALMKRCTSSGDLCFWYSANTGTNAWENEPSANKRRMKLGILNATEKA